MTSGGPNGGHPKGWHLRIGFRISTVEAMSGQGKADMPRRALRYRARSAHGRLLESRVLREILRSGGPGEHFSSHSGTLVLTSPLHSTRRSAITTIVLIKNPGRANNLEKDKENTHGPASNMPS